MGELCNMHHWGMDTPACIKLNKESSENDVL